MLKIKYLISLSLTFSLLGITHNSLAMQKRKREHKKNQGSIPNEQDKQNKENTHKKKKRKIAPSITYKANDLHEAIKENDYEKVNNILCANPKLVNKKTLSDHPYSLAYPYIVIASRTGEKHPEESPIERAIYLYVKSGTKAKEKKTLLEIIKLLLDRKADPNIKRGRRTLLDIVIHGGTKRNVSVYPLVELLISQQGIQYNQDRAIAQAFDGKKFKLFKLFIEKTQADISNIVQEGRNFLHRLATEHARSKLATLVLKKFGKKLFSDNKLKNMQDFDGNTPLHCMLMQKHEIIIPENIKSKKSYAYLKYRILNFPESLITKESVNKKNNKGKTPLILAFENQKNFKIIRLLFKHGARNDNLADYKTQYGDKLLHVAVMQNNLDKVNYLIKVGCNVNEKNKMNETPLLCLRSNHGIIQNKIKICELLILNGAQINQKIGNFPLMHYAIGQNNSALTKKLIELGADINYDDLNYITNRASELKNLFVNNNKKCTSFNIEAIHKEITTICEKIKKEKRKATKKEILTLNNLRKNHMHLSKLQTEILSDSLRKNLYINSMKAKKLRQELENFFEKEKRNNQANSFDLIKSKLEQAYKLIQNKDLSTYDKSHLLNFVAWLQVAGFIKHINKKYCKNILIPWNNLLNKIPFDYNLFYNGSFCYLRFILNLYRTRTKDMHNKTYFESVCNYKWAMPVVMESKYGLFFSQEINKIGKREQIKPLLRKLLTGKLSNQDKEHYPFLKTISKRILPLNVKNNKSYKHNQYHKNFMCFCAMFTLAQYYFGADVASNIIKYVDCEKTFDYQNNKSYVLSSKFK
ncbi:ankyrin repeat domain-containing protein [Candidatus Dependentiae bacterium]